MTRLAGRVLNRTQQEGRTSMCPTTAAARVSAFSLTFPPQPHWVRGARDAVRIALAPALPTGAELVELATLLTSELVTNAVTASLGGPSLTPITVHGEWTPTGTVRIVVHDQAPGTPLIAECLPSPDAEHGRGLFLISLYATDWGVCHHVPGPGKIVWFTLGGRLSPRA
ncbi:ATP-binding protein [Streptomyces sp. 6N223]|uniref:ATP-binding protein n=1 Tax=Streptomyces sp. 6N223 TaxID=3457412 RepID=UPI003FD54030